MLIIVDSIDSMNMINELLYGELLFLLHYVYFLQIYTVSQITRTLHLLHVFKQYQSRTSYILFIPCSTLRCGYKINSCCAIMPLRETKPLIQWLMLMFAEMLWGNGCWCAIEFSLNVHHAVLCWTHSTVLIFIIILFI